MHLRIIVCFYCLYYSVISFSQKSYTLPKALSEISGLEWINDTLLVAHNDGGNSPTLYLLSNTGKILKSVVIENELNSDWEDICFDGKYLYIADIGNNLNVRKDLKILRVKLSDLILKKRIKAESMKVFYSNQKQFPPPKNMLNYDSECLIYADQKLWIISKNKTIPFDGEILVYQFSFEANKKKGLVRFCKFNVGITGNLFDGITAGDYSNGYFYFCTYNRILKYKLKNTNFVLHDIILFSEYNQKEALTISSKGRIYVANEYNMFLGDQKMYIYSFVK